ncbi:hypothetical protein B0H19DRAFT_708892 [Mycena capillaripes]|nr:hypothetical protein B0H19DRAFT_708892 [Mycena capillaripes]
MSSWSAANEEGMIIKSLTLEKYHEICTFHLARNQFMTTSTHLPVTLGTVVSTPPTDRPDKSVGIAFSPNADVLPCRWETSGRALAERTQEGWTRFSTSDAFDSTLRLRCFLLDHESWLIQENYMFSRLHITSNLEDCVVLDHVYFEIKILTTTDEPPTGFLFLCPETDFQIGPFSLYWPDCPAYWSFDPFGIDRLNAEEAADFAFPSLELTTQINGKRWDNRVYAGIREFQRTKGFDPESQDVAREAHVTSTYRRAMSRPWSPRARPKSRDAKLISFNPARPT